MTPLIISSAYPHPDVVKFLVHNEADINARDHYGRTPLMAASREGSADVIQILFDAGADVDTTVMVDDKDTPLVVCAREGLYEAALQLIRAGADLNATDSKEISPLGHALHNKHVALAVNLIQSGAHVNIRTLVERSVLYISCVKGLEDVVEALLKRQNEPNGINIKLEEQHESLIFESIRNGHTNVAKLLLKYSDATVTWTHHESKDTVLMVCVGTGDAELVRLVIAKGVDINLQNESHDTACDIAARAGHVDIVQLLMKTRSFKHRDNAITVACESNHTDVFKLLLPTCSPEIYSILLMISARKGNLEMVQALLDHKASPTFCDVYGFTPLFVALQAGHEDVVNLLLPLTETGSTDTARDYLEAAVISRNFKLLERLAASPLTKDYKNYTHVHFDTLLAAVSAGDMRFVELIIKLGGDIHEKSNNGLTLLHVCNTEEISKFFISKGLDVDAQDNAGVTPLHLASMHRDRKKVLKLFVAKTKNINIVDTNGRTALLSACEWGNIDAVNIIIKGGGNVNTANNVYETPIFKASIHGHTHVVQKLIKHKAIVNPNTHRNAPFISACEFGHFDIAMLLLQAGANPFQTNESSPIALAAEYGNLEVVRALVELGEDLNSCSQNGTALAAACGRGHMEVCEYILDITGGHYIDVPCLGTTALCEAARRGSVEGVGKLLKYSTTNIDQSCRNGDTALIIAASTSVSVVQMLHMSGADITLHNTYHQDAFEAAVYYNNISVCIYLMKQNINIHSERNGVTPLSMACKSKVDNERERVRLVDILLKGGVIVNDKNVKGETALHFAAHSGQVRVVELLLIWGANIDAKTNKGFSPIDYAKFTHQFETINFLENYTHTHDTQNM
eukprot:GHVR01078324.1.p1 GENE.GHVR01078324.1~~GHVR01078324.1.p1  ORF type:complete len:922 (+),score=216.03 GHVR01078324.1:202-2766(+)